MELLASSFWEALCLPGTELVLLVAGGEHMERDALCRLGLQTPQEGHSGWQSFSQRTS